MQDRFYLRYVYKNKIYDVYAVDFGEGKAQLVSLDGSEMLFTKIDTDKLFQCTGLKDKSGKLIFEGDILRVTGSRDMSGYGVVEYLQAGCQFFVNGYLDNPSPYHPRKKGEFYEQLQEWLCTEVIGNIYENPELLEEKQCN